MMRGDKESVWGPWEEDKVHILILSRGVRLSAVVLVVLVLHAVLCVCFRSTEEGTKKEVQELGLKSSATSP